MGLPPSLAGKRWLTATEMAELLGVNSRTIRRWCALGKLPGQRRGNLWVVNLRLLSEKHDEFVRDQLLEMSIRELDSM